MNSVSASASAAALAFVLLPCAVQAQFDPQGWSFTAGAAAIYAPAYLGADNYQLSAFPSLRVRYADTFFASLEEGVGYNVINRDGWKVGPIVRYDFGRREDESSPFRIAGKRSGDLRGLGDVEGTLELGGFAAYSQGGWSVKAGVRQGVNGHGGAVGELEGKYAARIPTSGQPLIVSFGPRFAFSSQKYTAAYFGIDAGQALRTGLALYTPGGGMLSYGLGGTVIVPLRDRLSLVVFAGYDRLANAAAHSPVVTRRGSPNQAAFGISIGYEL